MTKGVWLRGWGLWILASFWGSNRAYSVVSGATGGLVDSSDSSGVGLGPSG